MKLLKPVRGRYALAWLLTGFRALLMVFVPRLWQIFIDYALLDHPKDVPVWATPWLDMCGPQSWWAKNLWMAMLILVTLALLTGVLIFFQRYLSASSSRMVSRRLRNRLYQHMNDLPLRFYDDHERGDLLQRCTSDIETVQMFIGQQVGALGQIIFLLPLGMIMMWPMSPMLSLVALSMSPILIAMSLLFYARIHSNFKKSDEAEGDMTAMLSESLSGARVVRAFARQDYQREKFAAQNDGYRDRWYHLMKVMSIYFGVSDLLCMGQIGLVTLVGAYLVYLGDISVGMLTAFVSYAALFVWPVRRAGRVLADAGRASVSMGRINEILHSPSESAPEDPITPPLSRVQGRIDVRGLTFTHPGQSEPALNDVSFDIRPGETLAILGPSGSGKSTLVNLMLRLYEFDQGEICIDGMDIRRLDRHFIRGQIGSVLQEPFLYSRTIEENIRFGNSSAREEQLNEAVSTAALEESIQRFEEGLETLIGERGVTLSGGQRQRVALARAILRNPPILIFDDALSAVDTHTERLILQALSSRHGRCTTIVIAHRMSTLKQADRAVVLDGGKIIQCGTHETLVQADGLYKRLWNIQSALEEDLREELGAEGGAL